MGWSIGHDDNWNRDIGYGVPAICDHPDCNAEIDRGLGYVCGDDVYGGDKGCGLFFCSKHKLPIYCERCIDNKEPFVPKPDKVEWIQHKLTDTSWLEWRRTYPKEAKKCLDTLCDNMSYIASQLVTEGVMDANTASVYQKPTKSSLTETPAFILALMVTAANATFWVWACY